MVVVLFLPVVVPLAFGSVYRPVVPGAQVMIVGVSIGTMFFWLHAFYYASGSVKLWVKGYACYTTLVIALGWFAIRETGFLGLAILVAGGRIVFTSSMLALLPSVMGKRE